MESKLNPEKMANEIFELFLKETEGNIAFRDALKNFIEAIEARENKWLKGQLG